MEYYNILEVAKDADDTMIKKAYRKLAMKYHPDKNLINKDEAEKKFKEVAEAYEILSDPDKRKIYDNYGKSGLEQGFNPGPRPGPGPGHGPGSFHFRSSNVSHDDLFGQMFGFNRRKRKGPPAQYILECDLEDLYLGATKRVKINRTVDTEDGLRRIEDEILELKVQPGWKNGTKMTFASKGDISPNYENQGDVIFIVKANDHNIFTREGNDLLYTCTIPVKDALVGFDHKIMMPTRKQINIKFKAIPRSDHIYKIDGRGMPIRQHGNIVGYGDLHVRFIITFDKLTDEQKASLKDLL
jgi:DnaJ family protein B protein 4